MRFSGPGSAPGVLQVAIGAAPSAWGTRALPNIGLALLGVAACKRIWFL